VIIKHLKQFEKISSIDELKRSTKTPLFEFDIETMLFCKENGLEYAVKTVSIKEAVIANELGATYAVVPKDKAAQIQNIANEYLFDTKILQKAVFDWEIEKAALLGVDGVLLNNPPF